MLAIDRRLGRIRVMLPAGGSPLPITQVTKRKYHDRGAAFRPPYRRARQAAPRFYSRCRGGCRAGHARIRHGAISREGGSSRERTRAAAGFGGFDRRSCRSRRARGVRTFARAAGVAIDAGLCHPRQSRCARVAARGVPRRRLSVGRRPFALRSRRPPVAARRPRYAGRWQAPRIVGPHQLAWLDATLAAQPERPTIIMMHHPPFATGITFMDNYSLDDAAAFAEVVRRHPQIERILCGHLHRAIDRRFAGTVAGSAPSTAHQIRSNLVPGARISFNFEPPGYQLHIWQDGSLVTHTALFGEWLEPLV